MKNNKWKMDFASVLSKIVHMYSIRPADIAEGFCNPTTVRKWLNGTRTPNVAGQEHLISYFERELAQKDSHSTYKLLCEQIENCLASTGLSSVKEIELASDNNTVAFVTGILRLCFGNIRDDNLSAVSSKEDTKQTSMENPKIKAVVFDFDGTLASTNLNRTTWEEIWVALGYDVELCRRYHEQFNSGIIDHATWCKITEDYFIKRNMHRQTLDAIAKRIRLIPGVKDVLEILYKNDIKVYIVSGSILHVIRAVLGSNFIYIDGIKANQFFFNIQGLLESIVGTRYDFEGKSVFIQELAAELKISSSEILFVGNSLNDEYAHISGAKTLCINPRLTDAENRVIWHNCIERCIDLKEILPYVNI